MMYKKHIIRPADVVHCPSSSAAALAAFGNILTRGRSNSNNSTVVVFLSDFIEIGFVAILMVR